jgi:uncharacterized membrane protein
MYIVLGINHFWHSAAYVGIMPTHYSDPHLLVLISGAAEILGGLGLLLERTRRWSAWGLMLMLVVYFDVHIFMIAHAARFLTIPIALLYARIPIQFGLIFWAWSCTRTDVRNQVGPGLPRV